MNLTREDVEAIAGRVVELLREPGITSTGNSPSLTAAEVADRLGVSTAWVYRHADELGARRLGEGPKARLRFDAEAVETYGRITSTGNSQRIPNTQRVAHLPRRNIDLDKSNVALLPIGRKAA